MRSYRFHLATALVALSIAAPFTVARVAPAFAADTATAATTADAPDVWDLKALYPNPEAWETEHKAIEAALADLAKFKGTLGTNAKSLLAAFDQISSLTRRGARLYTYANLKADEDTREAANQSRRDKAQELVSKLGEATAFVEPEIAKVGRAKIEAFEKEEPKLANHAYRLRTILRTAEHTLGEEAESVIAASGQVLSQSEAIYSLLANSDIAWPTIEIGGKKVLLDQEGYVASRNDQDRETRKRVFENFWTTMGQYKNTFGATMSAHLRGTVFQSKVRKYPNSLAYALSDTNMPESVYKTLVTETNAGLPTLHRYFTLRKKLLGLSEMGYYDVYVPLAKPTKSSYTLAEAQSLTLEGVKPLGDSYQKDMADGFKSNAMHAKPQRGKRSGAYMDGSAYDVRPFVLMSFSGNYESVSTLAHEWGHAMHSVFANKAQPWETSQYSTFIAEIPSTTNEMLLVDHVIATAKTKDEKIYALSQALELLRGTFFRQAMFAEFELKTHEAIEKGDAPNGATYTQIYLDLLKRYHGHDQNVVKIDDLYGIEWAYIPHFYNDFYVYQYATSISAAAYFAEGIEKGDTALREKYFTMLKAGGSDDPYEIVKRAGLDMASPAPYRAIVARMNRLMDQLEAAMAEKN